MYKNAPLAQKEIFGKIYGRLCPPRLMAEVLKEFCMKKLLGCMVLLFLFVSCAYFTAGKVDNPLPLSVDNRLPPPPPLPEVDYNHSHIGSFNYAPITVKDYEIKGIIFVKSSEMIDGNGNHTGSKITNEMLMLEAQKLGAHDVINIRIDVNQKEEFASGGIRIRTTYNYTASALAIKYTTPLAVGNAGNYFQSIGNNDVILNVMGKYTQPTVQAHTNVIESKEPKNNAQETNKQTHTFEELRDVYAEKCTVTKIIGNPQREYNGIFVDVKVGDVLTKGTVVRTPGNSSIVLSDGSINITITSGQVGRIALISK